MIRTALLLLVALSLVACADAECTRNTDCGDHRRCELNRCVSDCTADRDCESGQVCNLNGACVAAPVDAPTPDAVDPPEVSEAAVADAPTDSAIDAAMSVPPDVGDIGDLTDTAVDIAVPTDAPDAADVTPDATSPADARLDAGNDPTDAPDVAEVPRDAPDADVAADVTIDAGHADVVADSSSDASDGAGAPDVADGGGCVRTFSCEAMTAESQCGVVTATGRRYPDRGAPYCTVRGSRDMCDCDLIRCVSPGPLCPGAYTATFRERLLSGCDGVAGELSGTCYALWNVVQSWPAGAMVSDRTMFNVYLDWAFMDYTQTFTLTAPTQVRLVVQQSTWFSDVSGVGNSGRSEVASARIAPSP